MKKTFLIILSISFSMLLASCEDFLNNVPKHQWPVEEAMTTYSKAQHSVNGIYGRFMMADYFNQGYYSSLTTKSGLLSISGTSDFDMTYKQTNMSSAATSLWSVTYGAINACNLAINGIPKIQEASFPTPTSKTELIGEARLLRGYLNSIILLNYGCWWDTDESKFGIIYRDKTTDASNVNMPRITVGESWKKIFEDIDYGIANMPNAFSSPKKVSKVFAKAYKARLLLIRGTMRGSEKDLTDAKLLVEDVLSTLPSAIAMESNMAETFSKAWDSKEQIFVRYLEDDANRTSNAGYNSTYALGYSGTVGGTKENAICGLKYGLDWMRSDPRWNVSIGSARNPETWDDKYSWTWVKIYRMGQYAGSVATPKDEKYACYHMRLPELYIMHAELIARTGGSIEQSIAPINLMRSKRTNPVLPQLSAPASKEELLDIIFKEYVNELFLENGTEYYASIRFEKDGKPYMETIKGGGFVFEKTKLQWPIPNAEMINNPLIEQNPGQK